jgi:hypothetical protein
MGIIGTGGPGMGIIGGGGCGHPPEALAWASLELEPPEPVGGWLLDICAWSLVAFQGIPAQGAFLMFQ